MVNIPKIIDKFLFPQINQVGGGLPNVVLSNDLKCLILILLVLFIIYNSSCIVNQLKK